LKVPEEDKFRIIDDLKTSINSSVYQLIDIDGIRLENKNSWGLVRASNTAPNLVLRFEGKTESDLLEIKNYFKEILSKIEIDLQLDF
jgi:phosphomannomutase/phosphoglucomutase